MNRVGPLSAVIGLLLLVGCGSSHPDLVQTGTVILQTLGKAATLKHPPIVEDQDGDLVVRGQLDDSEAVAGGHLDIRVIAPDGTIVHDAMVNYGRPTSAFTTIQGTTNVGRRVPAGPMRAKYSVRFPGLPPKESVVHIAVDSRPHPTKER